MSDWDWDRKKVYGLWGWRRRRRFNLSEHLFESPVGHGAVALYHIGEVGLDSQVGHLLVLKEKDEPRVVWRDGYASYYYDGDSSVHWTEERGWALLYQCTLARDGTGPTQRHYEFRLMVLDLERERMARWERVLDRRSAIRMDGPRAILDDSRRAEPKTDPRAEGGTEQRPLICDLDNLSWRPFGRWQG